MSFPTVEPDRFKELHSTTTPLTPSKEDELKQHLYDLFGQNFLDGDKPNEWKAATINASDVKEYVDEFVTPFITQYGLSERIDELTHIEMGAFTTIMGDEMGYDTVRERLDELTKLKDKEQ